MIEKMIEAAAKAICSCDFFESGDNDRDVNEPTAEWYRKSPDNPQMAWELHKGRAEMALKAAFQELPDLWYTVNLDTGEKTHITNARKIYQQLIDWSKQ